MNERYTRLFTLAQNLYAEGAPVIIASGALSKDNRSGSVFAQVKMQSVSKKQIKAASVLVTAFDIAGRPIGTPKKFNYLDLNVDYGNFFGAKVSIVFDSVEVRSFTVDVIEVVYFDNTIWNGTENPWSTLNFYRPLDRLKDKAYNDVLQLYELKEYVKARTAFASLGNFKDNRRAKR